MNEGLMSQIPDEIKKEIIKAVLREAKHYLDEKIISKIRNDFEKEEDKITYYYQIIKFLKEKLPEDKFLDIKREVSKTTPEIDQAYSKYIYEITNESQKEWYGKYGLEENPFDFVSGIKDWKLFVGYESERKIIEDRIIYKKGKEGIINIYGDPLVGKTSFLTYINKILSGKNIVVSQTSRPSTCTDFLRSILESIIDYDKKREKTATEKIKSLIGDKIGEVSTLIEAKQPWASKLFYCLEEICRDNENKRFLFIVDESQYMNPTTIKYFLRALTIENVDVIMSQRKKIHSDEDIDAKTGLRIFLGGITKNETLRLIKTYLNFYRRGEWEGEEYEPFEEEAIDLIFKYSLMHKIGSDTANPGLVVKICHECVNIASLEQSLINEEIVKRSAKVLGIPLKKESRQKSLISETEE